MFARAWSSVGLLALAVAGVTLSPCSYACLILDSLMNRCFVQVVKRGFKLICKSDPQADQWTRSKRVCFQEDTLSRSVSLSPFLEVHGCHGVFSEVLNQVFSGNFFFGFQL